MKKRSLIIALLSFALIFSATLSIFFKPNDNEVNVDASNSGYESLFTVESEGEVSFTANKKDTLKNYSNISGLGVHFLEDVKMTYLNKINVGVLTKELNVLQFIVDPVERDPSETNAKVEFTDVAMRLENWDNPNEYIEIQVFNSIHHATLCWATASTHGIAPMGMKQGALHNSTRRGTPVKSNFSGNLVSDPKISLRYDNTLVTAFAHNYLYDEGEERYGGYTNMVRTFNKSSNVLGGEELFHGFNCDYVRLSITFTGVSNVNGANVIITSVLGQDFSKVDENNAIQDTIAPVLFYDYDLSTGIPVAEVGTPYPTFVANSFDAIDGVNSNISYSVYYLGPTGEDKKELVTSRVNLTDFTPQNLGFYELEVSIADNSKNVNTDVFTIKCVSAVEVLKCHLEEEIKSVGSIGETIYLPKYSLTGGSGIINESIIVYDPNGKQINALGGSFVLNENGSYKVVYSFSDYLGQEFNYVKQVRASISSKPVIQDVVVQKYLKKNNYIVLNQPKSFDYASYLGEIREVETEIYVAENNANGEYKLISENDEGKFTYMPSSEAMSLYVKYKAKSVLDENNFVETEPKKVEIVTIGTDSLYGGEKIEDYFLVSNGITKAYETVFGKDHEEIYFNVVEKGSYLEFLNPLRATGLRFNLKLDPNTSNFKKISFVLQDSVNPNETLTVSITPLAGPDEKIVFKSKAGESGNTNGVIANKSDAITTVGVKLSNRTKLIDAQNNEIVNFTKFDNGEKFTEFSSGKIFVKLIFDDFDETKINKFRIEDFYSIHALIEGASDLGLPIIVADSTIPYHAKLNDYVTIPSAKAYDDLSPNCDVYVTLVDPNGKYVLGTKNEPAKANKDYTVFVNVPGKYFLSYISTDENDEPFLDTLVINTLDTIVPIIEIDGQIKSTAKLGEAIQIPDITVVDNSTFEEGLKYYVYLETPTFGRKILAVNERRETFIFKEKGEFRLIVFAIDASGNFAQKDFKITVND